MDDLISRQAAIEVLAEMQGRCTTKEALIQNSKIWQQIKDLPSAEPDRKKGKWIYGEDEYGIDGYHCDKCGFFVPWDYVHKFINYIEDYNFCPSCGADMRGSSNEYEKIIGV